MKTFLRQTMLVKLIIILGVFNFTLRLGIGAEVVDTDSYFAFPRATMIAESHSAKVTEPVSRNFVHPTSPQTKPSFSSGHKFETGAEVQWEFLRKTEYGDVYLVITKLPGASRKAVPLLFDGTEQTVIETKDLIVRILPKAPPQK